MIQTPSISVMPLRWLMATLVAYVNVYIPWYQHIGGRDNFKCSIALSKRTSIRLDALCSCMRELGKRGLQDLYQHSGSTLGRPEEYLAVYMAWHWAGVCIGTIFPPQTIRQVLPAHRAAEDGNRHSRYASPLSDFADSIWHGALWGQAKLARPADSLQFAARYCKGFLQYPGCDIHAAGHAAFHAGLGMPFMVEPMPYSLSLTKLVRVGDQRHLPEFYHFVALYSSDDMYAYCVHRLTNCLEARQCLYNYFLWGWGSNKPLHSQLVQFGDTMSVAHATITQLFAMAQGCDEQMARGAACHGRAAVCTEQINTFLRAAGHSEIGFTSGDGLPVVRLRNEVYMPLLAVGTAFWPPWPRNYTVQNLQMALSLGWRHVDAAETYPGFAELHTVLSQFDRSRLFISAKLHRKWCGLDGSDCYEATINGSFAMLNDLHVQHVDLLMLHHPPKLVDGPARQCTRAREQWRALESLYGRGMARSIGVSNFCLSLMRCVMQTASVVPHVLQEMHHVGMGLDPYGYVSWAERHGISYMAYSVLGAVEGEFQHIASRLAGAALKSNTSPAEVALQWVAQQGLPLITLSTSRRHLKRNLQLFNRPGFAFLFDGMADHWKSQANATPSFWAGESCMDQHMYG